MHKIKSRLVVAYGWGGRASGEGLLMGMGVLFGVMKM